jgi:hypothetical protein
MQWLFDRIVKWGWKGLAATLLPGGWAYVSLTGLIKGRSGDTSGKEAGYSYSGFVVAVAPPVFLAGLLLVVSWGADSLASRLEAVVSTSQISQTSELYPQRHSQTIDVILTRPKIPDNKVSNAPTTARNTGQLGKSLRYADLIAAFVSLAVILALRLDANEFSMHLFYRNRLVRAFVGASNVDRKPNVFTGFARNDDLSLRNLVHVAPSPTYAGDTFGKPYDGPYPLWGTTLNITRGEDLSLQQRKGTSFIYSPLFCGWDYVPGDLPNTPPFLLETPSSSPNDFGYRKTSVYSGEGGRPFLGTAMAASGAAVSPNMGYHTRPGVAALLALFNVRLGWWTGNPRSPKGWCKYAPGAGYLLKELFSSVTADDTYVYLSDGGHFENLGLYELVRRRVPFIIAVDADADADYGFDNLGNAVEHCRRDFGVEIQIQAAKDMAKGKHTGQRKRHYALGRIVYPPGPEPQTGVLLYIKSSLTGDEPADVLAMVNDYKNFPNDSTANQFFNESLFESYRALGEHMMDTVFDDAQSKAKDNTPKLEEKWDVDFAKGEPGDLAKWFYGRLDARVPPSTPGTHV